MITTITVRNTHSGHTFPVIFREAYSSETTEQQARRYLSVHPYLQLIRMTTWEG